MSDGEGCKCWATCEGECTCGVDWTPKEVYDLRRELTAALERERVLEEALETLRGNCQYDNPPCEECDANSHCIEYKALARVKAMR